MSYSNFGQSFTNSYNLYMGMADRERKDRLAESSLQTDELRRQSYQTSIDVNQDKLDLANMTPAKLEAIPENNRTYSQLDLIAARKIKNLQLDTANINLETSEIANSERKLSFEEALSTVKDKKLREATALYVNAKTMLEKGTNPVVVASMLEEPTQYLINEGYFDFTKYGKEEYINGWKEISPHLDNGDFETIVTNHKDALRGIFSEDLDLYKGKNFTSKDGRNGIIQNVGFSGDFDPMEGTANMLVGGTFQVLFDGDDETSEVFSYFPDKDKYAGKVVQALESTDAMSISVADVVDKAGAEKDQVMRVMNNPVMFNNVSALLKGLTSYTGDPAIKKEMIKTHLELKELGQERIITIGNIASKARENAAEAMEDTQSAYLGALYNEEPLASDFIDIEQGDFGITYSMKIGPNGQPMNLDLFNDALIVKYANPERIAALVQNTYATYQNVDTDSGKKPFYWHEKTGDPIKFDTSKDELNAQLRLKIGDNFEDVKKEYMQKYEEIPGNKAGDFDKLTDEQHVAYVIAYLNQVGI